LRGDIFLQRLHLLFAEAGFAGQHAGQAKDGIQIRLLLERALGRGGAEGSDIALQQVTVKVSAGAKAAFDRQGNFQVTAQHLFLEQPAQTHLQRLGAGRHAHVQIEKSVVDALQERFQERSLTRPLTRAKPVME
jgi:hypothetical protein